MAAEPRSSPRCEPRPTENVVDFPRPPQVKPVPWRIRVEHGGAVVAETCAAIRVAETHHAPTYYIPLADIDLERVVPSCEPHSTFCEWKGLATYWDVLVPDGDRLVRAAWSYPEPTEAFTAIKGCRVRRR
ncbi:uncharacterized protein AMSG_08684 [Thecamonas trahens ATCC 50062]|uniref:DUF427 domain-containing protein n=1 Tax=Thecamonas trahens ATCC 50062 TaxID=461836 RepID=A0A0L0DKN4_THETB|nr:hypothetical protein AMSG_08684 [Thecamonas trahens ATCC 50062]KNC52795.1 hypothetical protein AMSG_08684 [Thecamonas trahens ATCC 50062]|eukprot:XP_013755105.1 hypothetical protein AMSG_08684 [Thecamonas trahens ATCC 50062]